MQIIKVLPSDSRLSSGRVSNDGTAMFFPTGGTNPDKTPIEIGVAIEDGLVVFLPDRAATHKHIMDVLGISHGRQADADASNDATMAVQGQVAAAQTSAVASDQASMSPPMQAPVQVFQPPP